MASVPDAAAQLGDDIAVGLSSTEAQTRLTQYGPDELDWLQSAVVASSVFWVAEAAKFRGRPGLAGKVVA